MKKYVCVVCGYVYEGEELPEDYECPLCADDLHLLPGDGKADWAMVLSRLKAAKPQTVLNFELKIRPKPGKCKVDLYSHLPLEAYLQEAAHRAISFAIQYFA